MADEQEEEKNGTTYPLGVGVTESNYWTTGDTDVWHMPANGFTQVV